MKIAKARGVFGFISDLYMISIPLYLIPSLSISARQKLSISTAFLTGLLTCIASAISMIYRFRTSAVYSGSTRWTAVIYATVIVELNIVIVCDCMLIVFVLLKEDAEGIRIMWSSISRMCKMPFQRTAQNAVPASLLKGEGEIEEPIGLHVAKGT
ncbi:hypothetical protein F5X96DRAFT_649428 [Biscogniauxia mediterranea]|nr:hypothetical protein F5X96DRAFT_649428 [Biscogniauxia mediterranea]